MGLGITFLQAVLTNIGKNVCQGLELGGVKCSRGLCTPAARAAGR